MGLCEVVAELAEAVALARAPLTAREGYLLYVLRGMPFFRDVNRLDLWDLTYKEVVPDDKASETERLIVELFELGGFNLYGAFDAPNTAEYYGSLTARLATAGIPVPPVREFRDW